MFASYRNQRNQSIVSIVNKLTSSYIMVALNLNGLIKLSVSFLIAVCFASYINDIYLFKA